MIGFTYKIKYAMKSFRLGNDFRQVSATSKSIPFNVGIPLILSHVASFPDRGLKTRLYIAGCIEDLTVWEKQGCNIPVSISIP